MHFPKSLQAYTAIIKATSRPAVLFRPERGATNARESKLGGTPYFPWDYNADYPKHPAQGMRWTPWPKHPTTGRELQLLLQINFADVPVSDPFPASGILQLFVDDEEWHDLGDSVRAVYHQDVSVEAYDFSDVPTDGFHVSEAGLVFEQEHEFITLSDFRFDAVYSAPIFEGHSFREFSRLHEWKPGRDYQSITSLRYRDDFDLGRGRNKLGGYHFSQNHRDPRTELEAWHDSVLLVQFQDYGVLSWGDGGSAQFFIKTHDLENRDFSDLLFHWDST